MFLILFNLFIILQINSYSQKCKFDIDKYDKFLKVNKLEKEVKAVKTFNRGNGYLTLNLCKYGDEIFFRLILFARGWVSDSPSGLK